jgi:hypothetical protein
MLDVPLHENRKNYVQLWVRASRRSYDATMEFMRQNGTICGIGGICG